MSLPRPGLQLLVEDSKVNLGPGFFSSSATEEGDKHIQEEPVAGVLAYRDIALLPKPEQAL